MNQILKRCGKYTAVIIALWSGYCFLIANWPQPFAVPEIRAMVRVAVVLIPAVLYYLNGERTQPICDFFHLRQHWQRGVLGGAAVAIAYFSIGWAINLNGNPYTFLFPTGFAIWVNFILGSPFAEELFFRGVLLGELQRAAGTTWAVLLSSFAFALLHLPQWIFLNALSGMELLSSLVTIFVYGIIFSLLVKATRSLWGAIVPHWINNFILLLIQS